MLSHVAHSLILHDVDIPDDSLVVTPSLVQHSTPFITSKSGGLIKQPVWMKYYVGNTFCKFPLHDSFSVKDINPCYKAYLANIDIVSEPTSYE